LCGVERNISSCLSSSLHFSESISPARHSHFFQMNAEGKCKINGICDPLLFPSSKFNIAHTSAPGGTVPQVLILQSSDMWPSV
jgi:hypothetical protein